MKYTLFVVLALFAATCTSYAQGLYVKAGLGYAMPVAGQTVDNFGNPYAGSMKYSTNAFGSTTLSYDIDKVSFSSGVQGILGFGYMFNANLGVEIDANLGVLPKKNEVKYSETDAVGPGGYEQTTTQYASLPLVITPALVLQVGEKKTKFYARGGLALPVPAKIKYDFEATDSYNPTQPINATGTVELKTRFGLGLSAALGAKYSLGKNLQLWAEVATISLSMYAKEQTVTEYRVNGANAMGFLSPDEVHQEFEKSSSGSAPNVYPTYALPFSNVSVNIGIVTGF